jgi:hypothetical protein
MIYNKQVNPQLTIGDSALYRHIFQNRHYRKPSQLKQRVTTATPQFAIDEGGIHPLNIYILGRHRQSVAGRYSQAGKRAVSLHAIRAHSKYVFVF